MTAAPPSSVRLPAPRKLHITPKQIEDRPVICGVCSAPFEASDDSGQDKTEGNWELAMTQAMSVPGRMVPVPGDPAYARRRAGMADAARCDYGPHQLAGYPGIFRGSVDRALSAWT